MKKWIFCIFQCRKLSKNIKDYNEIADIIHWTQNLNREKLGMPTTSQISMISCPKCGFKQNSSNECIKCGVIFSKYEISKVKKLQEQGRSIDKIGNKTTSDKISESSLNIQDHTQPIHTSNESNFLGIERVRQIKKTNIFISKILNKYFATRYVWIIIFGFTLLLIFASIVSIYNNNREQNLINKVSSDLENLIEVVFNKNWHSLEIGLIFSMYEKKIDDRITNSNISEKTKKYALFNAHKIIKDIKKSAAIILKTRRHGTDRFVIMQSLTITLQNLYLKRVKEFRENAIS